MQKSKRLYKSVQSPYYLVVACRETPNYIIMCSSLFSRLEMQE